MKILLATTNHGKIELFKKLLNYVNPDIEVYSPLDLGIEVIDTEENEKSLKGNALLKARAYLGKVDMPILSNDTGLYVEGEGFIEAPKRMALEGVEEQILTKEEVAFKQLNFWKNIATKHGGKVDAAWIISLVLLHPNGDIKTAEPHREIILTNEEFGKGHIQMPIRALYYSKATNKPAILHNEEEELLEMKPVIDALAQIIEDDGFLK
jgi:hypothetical protein